MAAALHRVHAAPVFRKQKVIVVAAIHAIGAVIALHNVKPLVSFEAVPLRVSINAETGATGRVVIGVVTPITVYEVPAFAAEQGIGVIVAV